MIKKATLAGTLLAVTAALLFGCVLKDEYDVTPKNVRQLDANVKSIVFIIDTSGSMYDQLNGEQKLESARKSLISILEMYREHNDKNHDIEAGLIYFDDDDIKMPVPLGKFDYNLIASEVSRMQAAGNTPLGKALAMAERELDEKASGRKFIVMLTDGENTSGREPADILGSIRRSNEKAGDFQTQLFIIAFNMDKSYFAPLEKMDAMVNEAKDAGELMRAFVDNTNRILEMPE